MQIFKEEQTYVSKLKDINCDVCGKSCRDNMDMNFEMVALSGSWGYCSHKDGTSWACDICEDCADKVREFIESLGGKIVVTNYM